MAMRASPWAASMPAVNVLPDEYTPRDTSPIIWAIGPSLALASIPLLRPTMACCSATDFGAHIAADGFSTPYVDHDGFCHRFLRISGPLALLRLRPENISPNAGRFSQRIGIWWASSLPVYMYFNPSWSHAHSAFAVALFLWYWNRTRGARTIAQWILLGLLSGFIVDVYYPNGALLVIPLLEGIAEYWADFKSPAYAGAAMARLFVRHLIYVSAFVVALLPTLITRQIIFGSSCADRLPPVGGWAWKSPALWNVLFSSDHGMLSWTPILILALDRLGAFSSRRQGVCDLCNRGFLALLLRGLCASRLGTACPPSAIVSSFR